MLVTIATPAESHLLSAKSYESGLTTFLNERLLSIVLSVKESLYVSESKSYEMKTHIEVIFGEKRVYNAYCYR